MSSFHVTPVKFSRITSSLYLVLLMSVVGAAQAVIPSDRAGLLAGEGMGLAAPGERNGFPGPKHVLELRDTLRLTAEQIKKTEELVNGVVMSATAKGEQIVEAENELEEYFASGKVQEKILRTKLEKIGKLRAELRHVHLQAHLRMKGILKPDQIALYGRLRGVHSGH